MSSSLYSVSITETILQLSHILSVDIAPTKLSLTLEPYKLLKCNGVKVALSNISQKA